MSDDVTAHERAAIIAAFVADCLPDIVAELARRGFRVIPPGQVAAWDAWQAERGRRVYRQRNLPVADWGSDL